MKKTRKQTPAKKPAKKAAKSEQNKQALKKVITPKKAEIEKKKSLFIESLKRAHGNVSKALELSGLNRSIAYEHFREDKDFREKWIDAKEAAIDELYAEAFRRGHEGLLRKKFTKDGTAIIDPETDEQYTELEYSDTLLIKLMNSAENQKKWRDRFIKMGELALTSIRKICESHNVANEIITAIEDEAMTEFDKINLV